MEQLEMPRLVPRLGGYYPPPAPGMPVLVDDSALAPDPRRVEAVELAKQVLYLMLAETPMLRLYELLRARSISILPYLTRVRAGERGANLGFDSPVNERDMHPDVLVVHQCWRSMVQRTTNVVEQHITP